ncbi:MAG TPA: ATP-binding cassette domain-containing protein [Armatimonadota bacterium]|jgi:ABC-type multidrug transport system ATPase subunit
MNCLEWDHVWARYGRPWALKDLSLAAEPGCLLAVMGLAGAGKSTLLRVASGGLGAESGRVWVDGRSANRGRARVLGSEETVPGAATVERFIERRIHKAAPTGRGADRRVKKALRAWDLDGVRGARIRTLPDSVRARVSLAAQWAAPAAAWLLDDPGARLDPEWRSALPALLKAWLEAEQGAIVLATHDAETAASADRVAILSAGRVAVVGAPPVLCSACAREEVLVRTLDNDAAAADLRSTLHIEAEHVADGLRMRLRRADAALPGILETLGPRIETVWIRKPTLRDAVRHFSSLPAAADAPVRPPR